jgi:hypothetical protein
MPVPINPNISISTFGESITPINNEIFNIPGKVICDVDNWFCKEDFSINSSLSSSVVQIFGAPKIVNILKKAANYTILKISE